MDFHTLSRRELQALCKMNKIPANITNVAMADALTALHIVEGIEELMNPSESDTAQSLTESMANLGITTPLPSAAGRSSRRSNVAKPETVIPMTRTLRTARKTTVEDASETPSLVSQTNRRKAQMASACRKMDSQLKECVMEEEDKKDVTVTPAPLGATSRRRRVDERSVKIVYSTRRSVRLAEKEVKNEEDSEFSMKKELLTKDDEHKEMNFEEGVNDFNDKHLATTGVDAITIMEEDSENKDRYEAVSAKKQDDMTIDVGNKLGRVVIEQQENNTDSPDEKDQYEVVSAQKQEDKPTDVENQLGSTDEIEKDECINVEIEAELQDENNTDSPYVENKVLSLNVANDVQESEGSCDNCITEIEITDEGAQKPNNEEDTGSQHQAADLVQSAVLDHEDNIAVNEFPHDTGFCDETEKDFYNDKDTGSADEPDFNATLVKVNELGLQQAAEEIMDGPDFIDHFVIPAQPNKDESVKTETLLHLEEESKEVADPVPSDAQPYGVEAADLPDQIPTSGLNVGELNNPLDFAGWDSSHLIVKPPTCLTPREGGSVRKEYARMKRMMACFSDNKENIGSGSKLGIVRERVSTAKRVVDENDVDKLNDLSVRKLTKMLKEKLEITKKSSKNENGNEALSRPALQALPEN